MTTFDVVRVCKRSHTITQLGSDARCLPDDGRVILIAGEWGGFTRVSVDSPSTAPPMDDNRVMHRARRLSRWERGRCSATMRTTSWSPQLKDRRCRSHLARLKCTKLGPAPESKASTQS